MKSKQIYELTDSFIFYFILCFVVFLLGASPLALRAAGSGSSLQVLPRIGINASRGAGFPLRSLAQMRRLWRRPGYIPYHLDTLTPTDIPVTLDRLCR